MKLHLQTHDARRISKGVAPSTGWPIETWVIYEKGLPYDSVAQVQIFRDKGEWCAWTCSIIGRVTKALAIELASKR